MIVVLALLFLIPAQADAAPLLVHSTFEDYAGGTLGDGGSNIYATRDGSVAVINRYDLNGDGNLDIYVLEDHNVIENADVYVYRGGPEGPQSILPPRADDQPLYNFLEEYEKRLDGVIRLPSDGGGRAILADLNNDGRDELVFCNYIHNYDVETDVFIYWNGTDGYSPQRVTKLVSLQGNAVTADDFNRDGFVDLAVSNGGIEGSRRWGNHLHLESYIYWNGPKGFSAEHRSVIPSIGAVDCASGDLDGDGFADLVFVNNNSDEKSIYVYWGGEEGFSPRRRTVRPGGNPIGIVIADVDGDNRPDWIALHSDHADVQNISNRDLGSDWSYTVKTEGANEAAVADLNHDGRNDIVFANAASNDSSVVYYGGEGGFPSESALSLPTHHGNDVAICDFNGDGWEDLFFANGKDDRNADIDSMIYWNGPEGFHPDVRRALRGFGPVSVAAGDINGDGFAEAILINQLSGDNHTEGKASVFWGNDRHYFDEGTRRTLYAGGDTAAGAAADVNHDGYVDLATGAGHVYLGTEDGLLPENGIRLPQRHDRGGHFADLNKDGYLDYVVVWGTNMAKANPPMAGIFWGSANGFSEDGVSTVTLDLVYPCISPLADLDRDGNLDLVVTDLDTPYIEIFYGTADGQLSRDHMKRIRCNQSLGAEIADLNSDGWLDLLVGGGWDSENMGLPTEKLMILWGGQGGFSNRHTSSLEAYDPIEHSVADLNKDGYLDIVTSNYHGYTTRTIPAFIYWGNEEGTFSESRRMDIPAESSTHVMAADFNQDHWPDLLVTNHIRDGRHIVGSNLFWGGPDGLSYGNKTWLPTFGVHLGMPRDIGNIYTRAYAENYVSAPFEWKTGTIPRTLRWTGKTPDGSELRFQYRSAANRGALDNAVWLGPNGPDSYYVASECNLSIPAEHRAAQYRAIFTSEFGAAWPELEEVRIE